MTVPAASRRSPIYTGNGVTTAFPFAFKVFAAADLQVIATSVAGVLSTLVLNSDYTVTLNVDQTVLPGGTITTLVAPVNLSKLVIIGALPYDQPLGLPGGGNFNPIALGNELDRQVMQIQQIADGLAGALTVPIGETVPSLPAAAVRAGYALTFDSLGNPVATTPVSGSVGTLATDIANAVTPSKGAGQVGFTFGLAYVANTVGAALNTLLTGVASLAASGGAALVGFIQAGAGAVARLVQDKLRETVSVIDYGGVLNSSGAGVRTANSAALLAALAQRKRVYIPEGTFWIAANTALSGFWDIEGASAEATIIKGDGDLFSVTTADNGEMRRFRNLKIINDVTKGKLFKYVGAIDTNRVQFDNVNFDNCNYWVHTSGGGQMVSWKFGDCRCINAAIEGFHFEGLWASSWRDCYVWYSQIGLRVTNGNISTNTIHGGAWEQMNDSAIVLDASNAAYELAGFEIHTHFEANGKLTNAADVAVLTSAATRARAVKLLACGFFTPTVTQSVRVSVTAGGGGNVDFIDIDGGACMGVVPLCTNSTSIKTRNVYYQSVAPQAQNIVPVQAQYQNSLNFLGSQRVVGVNGGNGQVQCLITPPTGTKSIEVQVDGNFYNGAGGTNIAFNASHYSAVNGNVRTTTDINHSAGANQGFIVTWTGTQIQVANKAALTNNQSGDTLVVFWG
jgi:hypothetical protein